MAERDEGQDSAHGWRDYLVRDADAGETLEIFLIASILSILGIRAFLAATGYPQLGGEGLHIAHMLWGGVFMLIGLLLILSYLNLSVRWLAALLGGIGFGTFIDELGKFITEDNDYFFQPTIALLYIIFILLFLLVRSIHWRRLLSPREVHINAQLRAVMEEVDPTPGSRLHAIFVLGDRLAKSYERLVLQRWFGIGLSAVFVVVALGQLITVAAIILGNPSQELPAPATQVASSLLSGLCIVIGVARLPSSRLDAYRWFRRGLLISILLTQVFLFLQAQLAALGGLAVNLLIYLALRYMIQREEAIATQPVSEAGRAATAP